MNPTVMWVVIGIALLVLMVSLIICGRWIMSRPKLNTVSSTPVPTVQPTQATEPVPEPVPRFTPQVTPEPEPEPHLQPQPEPVYEAPPEPEPVPEPVVLEEPELPTTVPIRRQTFIPVEGNTETTRPLTRRELRQMREAEARRSAQAP